MKWYRTWKCNQDADGWICDHSGRFVIVKRIVIWPGFRVRHSCNAVYDLYLGSKCIQRGINYLRDAKRIAEDIDRAIGVAFKDKGKYLSQDEINSSLSSASPRSVRIRIRK